MLNRRAARGLLLAAALLATACTGPGDDTTGAPSDTSDRDQSSPASSTTSPDAVATSTSEGPAEDGGGEAVSVEVLRADAVERLLVEYTDAINGRRPDQAYDLFTEDLRARVPVEDLVDGTSTSFISRLSVAPVVFEDVDRAVVVASFRTDQDPEFGPDGQSCSIWELEYRLVDVGQPVDVVGDWRIDEATPLEGTPIPCPVVTPEADQSPAS